MRLYTHTHTHTHTSVLLNNKKTESFDSLIVVPRNKNCIENSIQKEELKNDQEENLINNDTFYFKSGAAFFCAIKDQIKNIFCRNKLDKIENKGSRKDNLIKLVTLCAIMMLFNIAFSNSAYALEIGTAAEFINFTNSVSTSNTYAGQTININADINLNNTPLTAMDGFAGTLDGKGHTISGINVTSGRYRGLFGQITESVTIKNLTIVGKVDGILATYSGGFVAYAAGSNCSIKIENCVNAVEVNGGGYAGGFIGYTGENSIINNSYNVGSIFNDDNRYPSVSVPAAGGIIGYCGSWGTCELNNVYNAGAIAAEMPDGIYFHTYSGGLIGFSHDNSTTIIKNSYNVGRVSPGAPDNQVGAICGGGDKANSNVTNCYYLDTSVKRAYGNSELTGRGG